MCPGSATDRLRLLWAAIVPCLACAAVPDAPDVPGACTALAEAATRASLCDPVLETLAASIANAVDERACTRAIRGLLRPPQPEVARLRSVYELEPSHDSDPVTPAELERLRELPLPAGLTISPDVGPVPGLPPTTAVLDGVAVDAGPDGRLSADVGAGPHTVTLRHAGRTASACVQLRACETLEVVAHGAHLARHDDVATGACPEHPDAP